MNEAAARKGDVLALVVTLTGVAVAFLGRAVAVELVAGVALGLGGVLLALRGGRPIEGRAWLAAAVAGCAIATLATHALLFYEEWQAGQWFAEGAGGATPESLRRLHHTVTIARIGALACSLSFLLGAAVNKLQSGKEKGRD